MIGGVVWNYFQTPSTKQVTYAPVIIMGFGISVMYVMALAFLTDLIGENKVCDLGNHVNFANVLILTKYFVLSSFLLSLLLVLSESRGSAVVGSLASRFCDPASIPARCPVYLGEGIWQHLYGDADASASNW